MHWLPQNWSAFQENKIHFVKSAVEVYIWELKGVRTGAETMLRKQMFPRLRPEETFMRGQNLLPQQMFPL